MMDVELNQEQLLEYVTDGIFTLNREWQFTYVNRAAAKKFRKNRTELLGNNIWEFFPEPMERLFFHHSHRAMETHKSVKFTMFYPSYQIWVNAQIYPDPDGLAIVFQDVTEKQGLNQEQAQLLALLDSLFQSSPIGLAFCDRNLRFTHINQALATINGLPPEEHVGKRPSELLPDLDGIEEIEAIWQDILETGEPVMDVEVTGSRPAKPHEHRNWREHWFPVRLHDEIIGIGAVVEDVTVLRERERLAEQLILERERLVTFNAQLEEMVDQRTQEVRSLASQLSVAEQEERQRVGQILHDDVQQLLYSVQMRAYLVKSDLSAKNDTAILENVASLCQLIEDAIGTAHTLSHTLNPPVLEVSDVGTLLTWLADQMQTLHELEVTVKVQGHPRCKSKSYRILLFHIIRELLFNVVKHAGIKEVEVRVAEKDGFIQVWVCDTGQGFDPSVLSPSGAGMGLFSIQQRLRLFGGEMHVKSAPGEGTEITVTFPQ